MAQFPVYSSRDVSIAWGPMPLIGLAEDSFVQITPQPISSTTVGASGESSISLNPDRTGTVRISLLQQSPSNLYFSGLLNDQRYGTKKFKQAPIVIADPAGSIMALGKGAYFEEAPELTLGSNTEGNSFTWTFKVEELYWTPSPKGLDEATINQIKDEVDDFADTFASLNPLG